MKRITLSFSFLLLSIYYGFAQDNLQELKIGEKVPDVIIENIHNAPFTTAKLSDFKGKVVIIDFWATFCVPCIGAMPHLDSLQKKFHDKIQIVAVTSEAAPLALKTLHNIPSLKGLQLPIVTDDKKLRKLFPYYSVPHEIIIDQNGILKAITDGAEITEEHIAALVNGDLPEMHYKVTVRNFNYEKPFFMKDSIPEIQYHFLMTYNPEGLSGRILRRGETKEHGDTRLAGTGVTIPGLYRWAFLKKLPGNDMPNQVVLNVKDTLRFKHSRNLPAKELNAWLSKNSYCMDFIVPDRMAPRLYDCFKAELDIFFNLDSKMEKRNTTCWILKNIDSLKYKTSHITSILDWNKQKWTLQNVRVKDFIEYINFKIDTPLLDETGHQGNIDLTLMPNFKDMNSIKKQLNEQGLDIILAERKIDMIVLSDRL